MAAVSVSKNHLAVFPVIVFATAVRSSITIHCLCKMAVSHFSRYLFPFYHRLSGRISSTEVRTCDVTTGEMAAEMEKWQVCNDDRRVQSNWFTLKRLKR